ncbi:MAG: hypothetical protein KDA85_01215 [Planctomycetaceae bacterium]|nr:hypothetical protein [Planctomycetaceae bacterium]
MSNSGKSEQLRLGFLETLEVEGRGHVGGLLVTNQCGRPLEFQCTTPVKPNRTQEILYGTTLRPWLLGELIGGTLLERVSIKPDLIVTSDPDVLELRNHSSIPVACTAADVADEESTVQLGGQKLRFHGSHGADRTAVSARTHLVPDQADLAEPLERVREALAETVRTVFSR